MAVTIPVDEMTLQEKLDAMEAIWESLSADPSNVPSPSWHAEVLAEREESVRQGKARFLDWDECKKALLERFP
jgi:hypothetical protein